VPLDVVGMLLVSPGVVAVIYGLSNVGGEGGFGRADVIAPLVTGLVLLAAFAAWSVHADERALVDVRLFRHRALTSSSALLFLAGLGLYGSMLLLPLYWQEVRGQDALGAGLLLIAQGVGALASRTLAGRLTDSIGGRWVAVGGFAVLAIATVPFAFATPTTSETFLMAALFVRGLGFGAVTIPLMTGAYFGLERDEIPHASIITRVAMQLGGSFGVAVLAVILASHAAGATSLAGVAEAFDVAFWWAIGFTVLAVGLSFLLPGKPRAVR
jgi:predicted MFS family arabinose efflux permease